MNIKAEPFDFTAPPKGLALVVIDMQRDFLEKGGFGDALGNDVTRLQAIVPAVKEAIAAFRKFGLPVIHTREGHRPDLSDCPPAKLSRGKAKLRIGDPGPMGRILILGEPGNQIIPELAPIDGEIVLDKPGKGAFCATNFEEILKEKGVTHLAFAGVTTEVCVQTTMREANDRGYVCVLLEDCTESYFPQFKRATIDMVRAQGAIVGWTTTSRELIRGLEEANADGRRSTVSNHSA
ncbi:MAG TPA: cysteine hydrolase [Humisphaera sp.]|jgi:nicotinamidase-related amidase|nr:cysteine hydrolase [Humisphaera sp.]